jgi:uncharacterized iron-regulated membrane protein
MIGLRKLHRILGVWIALLVLLQVTGGMLLRLGVFSSFFYTVHTWFKYVPTRTLAVSGAVVAVLLGLSLATQAVSGVIMYLNMKVQQAKRKAKAKAAAAAAAAPKP